MKTNIIFCLAMLLVLTLLCACGSPNTILQTEGKDPPAGDLPPIQNGSDPEKLPPDGSSSLLPPDGSQGGAGGGSDSSQNETKPDPNAGVFPSANALTLRVGESTVITARVVPAFPTDPTDLSFSVSDESIASIDGKGTILAKSEGRVQICIQSGTLAGYCSLTVIDDRNENPGIRLESDSLRLLRGQSKVLAATFVPERVGDDATLHYQSDNPAVVTVDDKGRVSAHASGSAALTLCSTDGKYRATVTVTVPQSFSFLAAGDNLLHSGIYNDARERAGGSGYDFLPIYSAIADKVAGADFSMINQEGVFTGAGVSSYPKLNAPQEGIKALAELGFDIISLANNHCLDMGGAGLSASMTYLDTLKGVIRLGGYFKKNNDAIKTRVIEKDGIKVALLAYTTFTNELNVTEYNKSGVYVPWVEPYENTIDDIKRAKTKADAVLVFMHWGDEEQFAVTERQKQIAKLLADNGVDVIVGAHPHVIQPVEYIEAEDGRRVPCIYSLGTLVSNMMTEQNMLSCLATFDFVKDPESGKVSVENIEMDPYVFYYDMNYRSSALYRLPDLTDALAASHGIGNYPKDSAVKNTMSVARLYGYLREHIDPAFLPDDIQKELSK